MLALAVLGGPAAAGGEDEAPLKKVVDLTKTSAQWSYIIGLQVGANLKKAGVEIDLNSVRLGMEDSLQGRPPKLNAIQAQTAMKKMQEQAVKSQNAAGDKNTKEGAAFLAANKEKDGVVTTASGLQYIVLKDGTGESPAATDKVSVHYRGTLIDGTEFDSSYRRGTPTSFPVNGVIRGWTEALQLMKVGSKYKLFIPSNLAYGQRGAGAVIGPNATLVFEVELLEIKK